MAAQTIRTNPTADFSGLLDHVRSAMAAISAGWRAARDWRHLSANPNGVSREEIARAVFERNFA